MGMTDYRGMTLPDGPVGPAGIALYNNFKSLTERIGPTTWEQTTDPTEFEDFPDYFEGSLWYNKQDKKLWVCTDNTPNEAKWKCIFLFGVDSIDSPLPYTSQHVIGLSKIEFRNPDGDDTGYISWQGLVNNYAHIGYQGNPVPAGTILSVMGDTLVSPTIALQVNGPITEWEDLPTDVLFVAGNSDRVPLTIMGEEAQTQFYFRVCNSDNVDIFTIAADGKVSGAEFIGDGSGLTSLNGSNISSGVISEARLPASAYLETHGAVFNLPSPGDSALWRIPYSLQIKQWVLVASEIGTATIRVKAGSLADYLAGTMTAIDGALHQAAITSSRSNSSTALGDWTTDLDAGDYLLFEVESASVINQLQLFLETGRIDP
jgi:hypothetical protein